MNKNFTQKKYLKHIFLLCINVYVHVYFNHTSRYNMKQIHTWSTEPLLGLIKKFQFYNNAVIKITRCYFIHANG